MTRNFIGNQLKMQGFNVWKWSDRWLQGIQQNLQWIKEDKLKVYETVLDGFEKLPNALIDLLHGKYTGRVVVKV